MASEWIKGKNLDDISNIKNTDIASYLKLPPVKLHCRWEAAGLLGHPCALPRSSPRASPASMLAEDAIKAAVTDYQSKKERATAEAGEAEAA